MKNELKDRNLELISKKAEVSAAEAQKVRSILALEHENAQLRVQLGQIKEDYHKRIEVISSLKDNLAFLNESIQSSQEQKQEFRSRAEKYEERIRQREEQLKSSRKEIDCLEGRYKQIIESYIGELQRLNSSYEQDRERFLEEKEKVKEENYGLKVRINELSFEKSKLTKAFEYFKEEMEVERMAVSLKTKK